MTRRTARSWGFFPLLVFFACGCGRPSAGNRQPLHIFAAASLTVPLRQAVTGDVNKNTTPAVCSFGASGVLARQIAHGAPADIFISANPRWCDYLEQRGLLAANTRTPFLGNSLVVVRSPVYEGPLAVPDDLLGVRRLAVADMRTAPLGAYAKEFLNAHHLLEPLADRIVQASNAEAAAALVQRGEVDAAVVYQSDLAAHEELRMAFACAPEDHSPILYEAALIDRGQDLGRARTLLRDLWSPDSMALFTKFGYTELP